ncbi:unnamed protein product [Rotaria socialis]|uniref:Cystatin domain-containing protein n=1 Tax=Rotaria socialis TaxID=392032 RepID=A0A818P9Q1_9BILA|nr:unnamed protein product [Rotaria socialis]CAF4751596.1 unnamed protein product [Rotaria socialis]
MAYPYYSGAFWQPPPVALPLGGTGALRPLNEEDLNIWNMYEQHLKKKMQAQFNLSNYHHLQPVLVATQTVAGINYFFKVELPYKKYATVRVYHIPWDVSTHGKPEQVDVHGKLLDNPYENVAYF